MRIFQITTIAALLVLQGCLVDEPGQQCLNSFKDDLKDPGSGKVISFENPELVYTATNSYGGRVKGKALCKKQNGTWHRDSHAETLTIMRRSTEILEASNACMVSGKSWIECAGDSLALKHGRPGLGVDMDALRKESKDALGF